MASYKNYILVLFLLATLVACEDKWEDHTAVTEQALGENIFQAIEADPALSKFSEFLVKTEYDQVLKSSKTFTVFAPSNEALQNVDQAIVNDPERLKAFVGNHISYQQYLTNTPLPKSSRIQTLNGKYITWDKASARVDGAAITAADRYAGNGVLHVIDAAMPPKMSSWEFLMSTDLASKQQAYMKSLEYTVFIDSLATQTGVDPATGKPVYDSIQGIVQRNRYFRQALDISNEDSLYTFIVLTDAAFQAEIEEYKPYYTTNTEDSTYDATAWGVVKDLALRGVYTPENLPSVLYSRDSVKVHIDPGAIVRTERTSNGIVYVLNSLDLQPVEKLKPIRIEGEWAYYNRNVTLSHPEKAGSVGMRLRRSETGKKFTDILAYNHDIWGFHIRYRVPNVNSTTYKVYWQALNDFNSGYTFSQKVAFKNPTANDLPYTEVTPNNYGERVLVGEYTVDKYGFIDMYLVGALSTNDVVNPLSVDYIELVPVF
ncbi:fasciclin domain-containing protein [Pontibacter sp. E15-1]|uniref:fasciclin domain-containing protein n=1 Tax=Pontibacter sp. E15-1 TaxID=2919918 RepID=UPI001F502180|nr:fasciclin domain-containing protein [Pontibacter sp. E15-1]MCJ8165933.1 fasciclin domain-containing protein [Pontibacter sp. E15-1]